MSPISNKITISPGQNLQLLFAPLFLAVCTVQRENDEKLMKGSAAGFPTLWDYVPKS